jgi:hypothetical protein
MSDPIRTLVSAKPLSVEIRGYTCRIEQEKFVSTWPCIDRNIITASEKSIINAGESN